MTLSSPASPDTPSPADQTVTSSAAPAARHGLSPASTTADDASTASSQSASHSPSASSDYERTEHLQQPHHHHQQPISINFPLPSSRPPDQQRYDDRDTFKQGDTPRRPRRALSSNQFQGFSRRSGPPSIHSTGSARDEIEEQFLNRISLDGEAPVISHVLDEVDFRQVSDDDEHIVSDDDDDGDTDQKNKKRNYGHPKNASISNNPASEPANHQSQTSIQPSGHPHFGVGERQLPEIADDDDDDYDPEFSTIDLKRSSSSSVISSHSQFHDPHLFPSSSLQRASQGHASAMTNRTLRTDIAGRPDCDDCTLLNAENRRLRRQLDELEFEMASSSLRRQTTHEELTDDFYLGDMTTVSPIAQRRSVPHFQSSAAVSMVTDHPQHTMHKKHKSWTSRFSTPFNSSSSSKVSERAILKSQVQALTVTTEYLWRKLNKAETELRNYRLRQLRSRMKLAQENGHASKSNL